MSELKVNKISPRSGTAITLGDSGDTFTIPSGATLAIAGSVTGFTSAGIDDNATSVAITIDSSERVGIGSTAPGTDAGANADSLVIKKASGNVGMSIITDGSSNANIFLGDTSDNLNALVQFNDSANELRVGTSNGGGDLVLKSGASVEALRIDDTGRVGIGTSSPANTLDVNDSAGAVIKITRDSQSSYLQLSTDGSSGQVFSGDGPLKFKTGSSEAARINTDGQLLVGTTDAPSSTDTPLKIHVPITSSGRNALEISQNTTGTDKPGAALGLIVDNSGSSTNAAQLSFSTASGGSLSERMRINSSGNVGIGTTSPQEKLSIENGDVQIHETGSSDPLLTLSVGNTQASPTREWGFRIDNSDSDKFQLRDFTGGSTIISADTSGNVSIGDAIATQKLDVNGHIAANGLHFVNNTTSPPSGATIHQPSSNVMAFRTDNNERMRITDGGTILVSNTSEPSGGDNGAQISNGSYHIFCRNTSGSSVFRTFGSSGEFRTLGNGNAANTNNVYGAISDRELKENEIDANSQWNDIKALQIKNYNLKSQPNQTHLGVIAQDLEASGMNGLVEQNEDEIYTGNDVLPEGKNIGDVKEKGYKTVKYSVLYMKSVKALQEAMTRIESLEAEVTALKNQP